MQYYRQPKYVNDFKCIGGKCPNSCCIGWRIDWRGEEIDKLRAADCSPELEHLVNTCFEPNDDIYSVILTKDKKRCPFLTEENLCHIQKELGEDHLSYTCTIYPRQFSMIGNNIFKFCCTSCYAVIDELCRNENSMDLINREIKQQIRVNMRMDTQAELEKYPKLKYRRDLFEFFWEIISSDKRSLESSIVLGALAAQKLSQFIEKGQEDMIPEIIKTLRPQLNDPAQLQAIDSIKPNYNYSIGITGAIVSEILKSNLLDPLSEDGAVSLQKYNKGMENFNKVFDGNSFALRNIAIKLMLETFLPFRKTECTLFENYSYFVFCISAIKLTAAAVGASDNAVEHGFKVVASHLCRSMIQSVEKIDIIFEQLKQYKCTTPATIALLIK